MKKAALLFSFTLIAWHAMAQKNPGFGANGTQEVCSQLSFSSDEEVMNLVGQILDYAGVSNRSYEVKGCSNASGCFATVIKDQQYIVYQPDYLKSVKKHGFTSTSLPKESKDWQALTILAHEVGHLINGHFYNSRPDVKAWDKELQADVFAGRILYQMNSTLEQAQDVYFTSIVPEQGSMSHPPRKQRLEAIAKGYNTAARLFPKPNATVTKESTFSYVEVMPEFQGNLGEFLSNNLVYPKDAQENNIEGRVTVKFVVTENGSVKDAMVTRSVHPSLDAEALRVVNAMPRWKPGSQNGKAVNVYFNLPINFKLEDPEPQQK